MCCVPREVGGGWGSTHNEELDDAAEEGEGGKEGGKNGWSRILNKEEEDEEEVKRGIVGGLRGTEMLHNQLSRVFSSLFYSSIRSLSF